MQTKKNNHSKRNPNVKELAKAGWNLCHTILWSNQEFNESEIELAQDLIEKHLLKAINVNARFVSFCERVQMAYQYLQQNPNRFVPHPLKWLSPFYEYGFCGTKDWYMNMVHERTLIPVHRFELRVMAEAYWQYVFEPTKEQYQQGKKAIMHYNTTEILQAYNNAILNFNYNN